MSASDCTSTASTPAACAPCTRRTAVAPRACTSMRLTGAKVMKPLGRASSFAASAAGRYSPFRVRAMASWMLSGGTGSAGSIPRRASSRPSSNGLVTRPSMLPSLRLR